MRVLVIGASANPSRTSNQAVAMLQAYDHEVIAIGSKEATVHGIEVITEKAELNDIDTVTLYINPSIQSEYYDYLKAIKPRRVIFNPGTEHPDLMKSLLSHDIEIEEACTLVMLRTNQF